MKYVVLTVAFLLAASLNACDTMAGAGQDISKGGDDITHAATH